MVNSIILEENKRHNVQLNQGAKKTMVVKKPKDDQDIVLTAFPGQEGTFKKLSFRAKNLDENQFSCTIDRVYGFCILNPKEIGLAKYVRKDKEGKVLDENDIRVTFFMTCSEGPCDVNIQLTNFNHGSVHTEMEEISFKNSEIQLFDVEIPDQFDRILVPVQFKNRKKKIDKNSAQLEDDKLDIMEKHFIDDYVVFEFRADDEDELCRNCAATIQLYSDSGSTAQPSVFYYLQGSTDLVQDGFQLDSIRANEPQEYTFKLNDENGHFKKTQFLKFSFKYIKEKVNSNVIITGGKLHETKDLKTVFMKNSLEQSKKMKKDRDDEQNKEFSLIFRRDEIEEFEGASFHFVIYSYVSEFGMIDISTYTDDILEMKIDQVFTASVQAEKYDYYLFKSPNMAKLGEKKSVSIILKQIIGKSSLMVKKLQYKDRIIESLPSSSDFSVKEDGILNELVLDSSCSESDEYCYFQIFVKNNDNIKTDYQLEAAYTSKQELVTLKPNLPFSDYVLADEYKDYFFTFDDHKKDISHIDIRISTGLVQIYAAGRHQCQEARPDTCDYIRQGNSLRPIKITKIKDFEDGILISTKSRRPTDFHITVEVHRLKDAHFIELQNTQSLSNELTPQKQEVYYTYDADLEDEEDIIINVQAPSNKATIVVNNDDEVPSLDSFQWVSRTNYLRIRHKSDNDKNKKLTEDFKQKGKYTIAVVSSPGIFPETEDGQDTFYQHVPFKIMVSGSKKTKPITFGEVFFDVTTPQGIQYYEVRLNATQDKAAYISRNIMNDESVHDDLKFYIGNDIYSNMTRFQYVLEGEEKATFELDQSVLDRLCHVDMGICQIFIAVKNFGKKQISYSITTWEQQVALQLIEGLQYQYTLHHIDRYMNFYYKPTDRNTSLNFDLYSLYGLTYFNVKVYENEEFQAKDQWPFPQDNFGSEQKVDNFKKKDIDYTSGVHHSHSFTITEDKVKQFTEHTVILISVIYMEQEDQSQKKAGDDQFKLLVSTNYMNIFSGQRIEFTLEKGESKYSFLQLRNILLREQNESVFLQLTALSGQAGIAVSIRDDMNDRIPEIEDNDIYTMSNYIELTPKEMKKIMKDNKLSIYNNPTLVIEVSSYSSSGKFVLMASTDKSNQIDVLHGVPSEFHLSSSYQKMSFRYYNYINEDLQIKIARDYGFGNFSVTSCESWSSCDSLNDNEDDGDNNDEEEDDDEENNNNLGVTNGENYDRFISGQTGSFIEIKKGSSLWCKDCYYMITVQNYDHSEFHGFLYVLVDDDAIWLPEGRTVFDNNDKQESNLYRMSVPSNEETTLSMMVYWGNPKVYVNYYPSRNFSEYSQGPFQKSENGQLEIQIPARDNIMDQSSKSKKKKRKDDKMVLDENSFYSNMVENEIYVMVVNPEKTKFQSNYSITYFAGDQERYISDGHILPTKLGPQQSINFMHQYYDNEAQAIISISLKNYKDVDISNIEINATLQEQESRVQDMGRIKKQELQKFVEAKDHVNYALPNKTGAYKFTVTNNGNKEADLSIYVNTRDMTLLPLNHKIEHYLTEDSINYYEVIIPYKGFIALDIQHCTGSLHMGYTQEYKQFVDHNFTQQTQADEPSVPGHTYLDIYPVKKGTFYIALYSNKEEGALYTLKANFYKEESQVPHAKLDAGQQGFVQMERNGLQDIYLEFSPIVCTECKQKELEQARVKYTILWSTDKEILHTMGICGVNNYFDHKLQDMQKDVLFTNVLDPQAFNPSVKSKSFELGLESNTRLNYSFPIQNQNASYYATIKAEVHNFPGFDEEVVITYNTVQIVPFYSNALQNGLQKDLMYLGGITLVIFTMLIICLFCRRIFKSSTKGKFHQQVDLQDNSNQYGHVFNVDQQNISVLDKSQEAFNNNNTNFETDFSEVPDTDRSNQDFTFSKKIEDEQGIKQFNKFEDDI